MNLFGIKKKQVNTFQPADAIQKLHDTLAILEKREEHLAKQIALLKKEAVSALKEKQRSKAVYSLKKSKIYEKQVSSIFNTKLNIETQIAALSQANINIGTISAMKAGRDVLVQSEKTLDPDNVASVMEDLEEKLAGVDEVSEALGRSLGPPVDEDELLRQLEQEMDILDIAPEVAVSKTEVTPVQPLTFPSVPVETEEDAELRELEKIMMA
jgi:charged multivesicular body protein 4A/B